MLRMYTAVYTKKRDLETAGAAIGGRVYALYTFSGDGGHTAERPPDFLAVSGLFTFCFVFGIFLRMHRHGIMC